MEEGWGSEAMDGPWSSEDEEMEDNLKENEEMEEGGLSERKVENVDKYSGMPVMAVSQLRVSDWWEQKIELPWENSYFLDPLENEKIRRQKKAQDLREKREQERELAETSSDWKESKLREVLEGIMITPEDSIETFVEEFKWLGGKDVENIVFELVDRKREMAAYKVYSWAKSNEWHEENFDLLSNLTVCMAEMHQLSHCSELYDTMISQGMVPTSSTHETMIEAFMDEGEYALAWNLCESMKVMGGQSAPDALLLELFLKIKTEPYNTVHALISELILEDLLSRGCAYVPELYLQIYEQSAKYGDVVRVHSLFLSMEDFGISPTADIIHTLLLTCEEATKKQFYFREIEYIREGLPSKKLSILGSIFGENETKTDAAIWKAKVLKISEECLTRLSDSGFKPSQDSYLSCISVALWKKDMDRVKSLFTQMNDEKFSLTKRACSLFLLTAAELVQESTALQLLNVMQNKGLKPSLGDMNCLLTIYARKGAVGKAIEQFEAIKEMGFEPDTLSYNLMVAAHLQKARPTIQAVQLAELHHAESLNNEEFSLTLPVIPEVSESVQIVESMSASNKPSCRPNIESFEELISTLRAVKRDDLIRESLFPLLLKVSQERREFPTSLREICLNAVGRREFEKRLLWEKQLSVEEREVLVGVLLGGAKLKTVSWEKIAKVEFSQLAQLPTKSDLILNLYSLYKRFTETAPNSDALSGPDVRLRPYYPLSFSAGPSPLFYPYLQLFYAVRANGSPTVPRLIKRWLTPRSLAYWYMYGGFRCITTGGIVLPVQKYSLSEIQSILACLDVREEEVEVKARRGGYLLRFRESSSKKLWRAMEPFVLSSHVDLLMPQEHVHGEGNSISINQSQWVPMSVWKETCRSPKVST